MLKAVISIQLEQWTTPHNGKDVKEFVDVPNTTTITFNIASLFPFSPSGIIYIWYIILNVSKPLSDILFDSANDLTVQ